MKKRDLIAGAVLVAAALLGFGRARGVHPADAQAPTTAPAAALNYRTSCAVSDFTSLNGYVRNLSADAYRVRGQARFKFRSADSISRPEILVPANSLAPAGENTLISTARLAFALRPGETCLFDVADSIRKE